MYGYAWVASLSSLVYGYNTGIIAPAILFIPDSIEMGTFEMAAIVSIILIGATIGALMSGILADRLGRRSVLASNNVIMLGAAVLATLGESSELLVVSRFVLGLGVGVASVVPALYITEMAPAHARGQLGAMNQLLGWTGIIVAYFVGYGMVTCTAGDLCWRGMFASGAVLCIFHLVSLHQLCGGCVLIHRSCPGQSYPKHLVGWSTKSGIRRPFWSSPLYTLHAVRSKFLTAITFSGNDI